MTNLYREAVFPVAVALCVIIEAEHCVVKPVVPKFCRHLCNETARCHAFIYKASDLSCHLISETKFQHSIENVERLYAEKNMICPNDISDTNRKSPQLKRLSSTTKKGREKKTKNDPWRRKPCKPPDKLKTGDERSHCIIYRRENITRNPEYDSILVVMPLIVKPGMKIVAQGEYMKGRVDSQLSLSRSDYRKKTTLPWLWFHIFMKWKVKELHFTEGFHNVIFDGDFPFTDPSNFTMAMELMSNSTKIYAGKVLAQTVKPFHEIADIYFRRYKKVHFVEVQKTWNGSDEMYKGNI